MVHDLETIAETARLLFEPVEEPSDDVWVKIKGELGKESTLPDEEDDDEVKEID